MNKLFRATGESNLMPEVPVDVPRPTLSVIMPVYNERATLPQTLERVLMVPVSKEIFVVNDGSTDGTREYLANLSRKGLRVLHHESTRGKGAAIRTALPYLRGEYLIVQDGDLEYDPMDYLRLLDAAKDSDGVVYGSRNRKGMNVKGYASYWMGGVLLSSLTNLLYGTGLTDVCTCYKLIRSDILQATRLECAGFEFCPEITAKIARQGIKIEEVPISYSPRTFREGKKIRWTDGLQAAWVLIKLRFVE